MLATPDQPLTIQQAARATGLSIHTLRYYERIDLLDPVTRAANGHRRYSRQDVERIIFLNTLRLTGMSLDQIRAYSALVRRGEAGVEARIAMLREYRKTVAAQIEDLSRMLTVIDYKVSLLEQQVR